VTYFLARANQAEETIERVRELHKKIDANDSVCGDPECCGEYIEGWTVCQECYCDYPCKTIKALDGEIGSVEPVKSVALDGEQGE